MATKLELYNKALGWVGASRLYDLTEERSERYELDAVYDGALQYMLELASWKFALRTSELTYDLDLSAGFGPAYAFAIPSDFKRLAGISTNGDFSPGSEPDFIEENGYWISNNQTIYVKYVSNGVLYGLNLGAYPENYAEAVGTWLALKAALPIAKDRGDRDQIFRYHKDFLSTSKRLDAIRDPVKAKPTGRFVSSRGFGSSRYNGTGRGL